MAHPGTSLRIGVDVREWVPGRSTGIGRYLELFLQTAPALRPAWSFLLFGSHETQFRVVGDGITPVRLRVPTRLLWDEAALPLAARRHRIDVMLCPYYKTPLIAPFSFVLMANDTIPLEITSGTSRLYRGLFRLRLARSVRRAGAIVAISHATQVALERQFGPLGDRIRTVHVGVSGEFHPRTPNEVARVFERYALPPHCVVTVTNFRPHKNLDLVLRAHSLWPDSLRRRHPLAVVGSAPPGHTSGAAKVQSLHPQVRSLGPISDDDLAALFSGASLVVHPALQEGFGLPVLEALACGAPIVASDLPVVREVAGEAAVLLPPDRPEVWADRMQDLVGEEAKRQQMSRRALERARRFTPAAMAQGFLAALETAAG
ncbi:MAG: glycosyltransferase family 4 protein [Nitrospirae bacterium]|nr:glycosyltransferase family 4 protein [Nitrospirota bacterium]